MKAAGSRQAISEQGDRRVLTGKVGEGHTPPGAALILAAEQQQFAGRVEQQFIRLQQRILLGDQVTPSTEQRIRFLESGWEAEVEAVLSPLHISR